MNEKRDKPTRISFVPVTREEFVAYATEVRKLFQIQNEQIKRIGQVRNVMLYVAASAMVGALILATRTFL